VCFVHGVRSPFGLLVSVRGVWAWVFLLVTIALFVPQEPQDVVV